MQSIQGVSSHPNPFLSAQLCNPASQVLAPGLAAAARGARHSVVACCAAGKLQERHLPGAPACVWIVTAATSLTHACRAGTTLPAAGLSLPAAMAAQLLVGFLAPSLVVRCCEASLRSRFLGTRQPALCPDFLQRRRTPRPAPAPLNSSLVQLSSAVSPRALPIVHSHECLALPLSARVVLALLPLCCHIVSPPNNSGMPACHAVCNATGVRFTLQMAAGKRMLGKGG
jgi:hypothetical protein